MESQVRRELNDHVHNALCGGVKTEHISSVDCIEVVPGVYQVKVWPKRGAPEYFVLRLAPWQVRAERK